MKTIRINRPHGRLHNKLLKNKILLLSLAAALLFPLMSAFLLPQPARALGDFGWEKESVAPIIPLGSPGDWDAASIGEPAVVKDGANSYKLWYSGSGNDGVFRIGYATSNDGTSWIKNSTFVLPTGAPGAWDAAGVASPAVVKDGSTYKMWYMGEASDGIVAIGYATSGNGTSWNKTATPVLTGGAGFEAEGVGSPSVILDGATWKMWYTGKSSGGPFGIGSLAIGYATSPHDGTAADGVSWIKSGSNPVLTAGAPGSWESRGVGTPSVIKDGAQYKMWYTGYTTTSGVTTSKIGYAYSSDGTGTGAGVWNRSASNPIVGTGVSTTWEGRGVGGVSVINDTGAYKMWYSGLDSNLAANTGLAIIPVYTAQTAAVQVQDPNGVVDIQHNITGITSSGLTPNPSGGIASYAATASYSGAGINVLNVAEASPFSTPSVAIDNGAGSTTYSASQTGSTPQAPMTVASLVVRLVGSKDNTYTLTLTFNSITTGGALPVNQAANAVLSGIRRGDANGSNDITIVDALFIAQYLAHIRAITDLNPINSASVRYDGVGGDTISITDALFIAQMLAFIRDGSYNLI